MSPKPHSSHIPRLRFPGFFGEWEEKKIKETTNYVDYRGKGPNKVDKGIFLITAKNIKKGYIDYSCSKEYIAEDDYNNVMSKGLPQIGDILFTTEAPLGNIAQVNKENIALAQRVIKFRGKDGVDNTFLMYLMLSDSFQRLIVIKAIGSTVIGIQGKVLHNLKISFPILPEQTKIASFLSAVDDKIQSFTNLRTAWADYKTGIMQQIFNQEIRFPGFTDEWEEKKLGEVLDYEQPTNYLVDSTEYSNKYNIPVVTAGKTFILGYTNEVHGIYKDNLPVIIFDDFTTATQFIKFPFKAKSSAMKILKAKKGYDIKFIYEVMQNIKYEVGGHGRHWISVFSKLDILIPSPPEQEEIANFLISIDDKISELDTQIQATKQWKTGLLQGLFI